jgi:hypothetical protein
MARTILQQPSRPPARSAPDPSAELLASAQAALDRAAEQSSPAVRYELAYLAALRSAAAVLARRARPRSLRTRPRGIWRLLARAAPELGEWAEFFALVAVGRDAPAGGRAPVTDRQADDLLRDSALFTGLARGCLAHRDGRGSTAGPAGGPA